MTRPACNCAGAAPGYPQHETYCGQEPDDDGAPEKRTRLDDEFEAWLASGMPELGCPPGCDSPFCDCPGTA